MQSLDLQFMAIPGAILVFITALLLISIQEWRISLAALAVQYLGVFILVAIHWPLMMALTKLLSGWICALLLGMAMVSLLGTSKTDAGSKVQPRLLGLSGQSISTILFRLVAAAVVALVVFSLAPALSRWIPGIQYEQVMGALVLLGFGLLHLGLTANPLRVIFALLTILSGFEILYSAVEVSTLVAGLLAGVNLGLAMIGAYLLIAATAKGET